MAELYVCETKLPIPLKHKLYVKNNTFFITSKRTFIIKDNAELL